MGTQPLTRGWLGRDIIQTQEELLPTSLEWICERCGLQLPVALAGNRWVRRSCRCEREQRANQAVGEKKAWKTQLEQQKVKAKSAGAKGGMTRLDVTLSQPAKSRTPPPELFWSCQVCGELAPFALPSGKWIRRTCACQRQEREAQERAAQLEVWKQEKLVRTFGGWLGRQWTDEGFARSMASKTFANYDQSLQPDAFHKAAAFARRPIGNLLFWSEQYGLGKTHLEAAICNYLRDSGHELVQGDQQRMPSIFVSAPQFFAVYHETKKAFDQTAHLRLMANITGAPLLVIDDVDKRTPQRTDLDIYWLIFDSRYTTNRPTILSTNRQTELDRFIGPAALSRFSRGLVAAELSGTDYRQDEVWKNGSWS